VKLSQILAVFLAEFVNRILLREGEKDEKPYQMILPRRFVIGKAGSDDWNSQGSAGQLSDQAGTLCFFCSYAHFPIASFSVKISIYLNNMTHGARNGNKMITEHGIGDKSCIFNNLHHICSKSVL